MIDSPTVEALLLEEVAYCSPSDTRYRIFRWPEFAHKQAALRECSISGHRLPKKDQVVLTFFDGQVERRILLNTQRLSEHPASVKWLINQPAKNSGTF